jgi:hypothetical protein
MRDTRWVDGASRDASTLRSCATPDGLVAERRPPGLGFGLPRLRPPSEDEPGANDLCRGLNLGACSPANKTQQRTRPKQRAAERQRRWVDTDPLFL